MNSIFETILHSDTSLSDIQASVDPFTGRTSTFLPVVTRLPGGPIIDVRRFLRNVQAQRLRCGTPRRLDPRLVSIEDVFNPGVAHFQGGHVMLVRFQNSTGFNDHYRADSTDGVQWEPVPQALDLPDLPPAPREDTLRRAHPELPKNQKWHVGVFYDPRITEFRNGEYLVTIAVDYDTLEPAGKPYINVCDNVLYRTRDFRKYEYVSTFAGDSRNGVIFPRKIDGYYWNAGRPNSYSRPGEPATGQDTVLFRSRDLVTWEKMSVLFSCGHRWMNYGGPGFPPFETEKYWVMGVHGVEVHGTHRVHYRAGVCLIDKSTMKLVGRPVPILDPRESFELTGLVDNVVFPTGLLFGDGHGWGVKASGTKIALYYGGADRVIHVGLTTVGRLVDAALGRYDPFTGDNPWPIFPT